MIELSIDRLLSYIEKEEYKGFDPYDMLNSPLFNLPVFNNNKIRFLAQQLNKRSPVNFRNLFLIPKGYNPVTLGLCIQAYGYLIALYPEKSKVFMGMAEKLLNELEKLIPVGYDGACWGYDFDWEARYSSIPAFQPTIVATGIISNGLFEYYKVTKNIKAYDLILSASKFVIGNINRTILEEGICFSYSPFDHQLVFNASAKGIRILSQAYSLNQNSDLLNLANKAVKFLIKQQNVDGSWYYSLSGSGNWIDNYHTGYLLDCLHEYFVQTKDVDTLECISKGWNFYRKNLFYDTIPKFYHNKIYPVDCTAASQSILTLTRFGDLKQANSVALYMINNMQAKIGYFYFRRYKYYVNRTSFMRWSNAWMLLALVNLLRYNKKVIS